MFVPQNFLNTPLWIFLIKNYNKVAAKFGSYKGREHYTSRFSDGEPEKIFLEQLLKYAGKNEAPRANAHGIFSSFGGAKSAEAENWHSSPALRPRFSAKKDKVALDIGCADGRFTLKVAKYFKQIFAIDISSQMLKAAGRFQAQQKVSNVAFQEADAEKSPFQNKYFDVIYSRRGPSPYVEIGRTIKTGGYYLEICIGEKDTKELKEVFGRGQGFDEWNTPVAKTKTNSLIAQDFKIVFVHDYFYSEIYPDVENLDLFLQGVPIFKDFDSEKDKKSVLSYVQKMKVADGIELKRHRVVIVAIKS